MASFSFGNSLSPYSKYIVNGTGNYTRFITQPETGTTVQKLVNSMFLGVKTSQNLSDPVTFLIFKPKNLWLSYKTTDGTNAIKDVYSNEITKIINYSPEYADGKEIKINYLPYPISVSDLFPDLSGNDLDAATKEINVLLNNQAKFIFAEDINADNRTRIAAPNLPPSNYDSFSRWL